MRLEAAVQKVEQLLEPIEPIMRYMTRCDGPLPSSSGATFLDDMEI